MPKGKKKEESMLVAVEDSSAQTKYSKIRKVVKRDGNVVDFDRTKIEKAVLAALNSVNVDAATDHATLIANKVVKELEDAFTDKIPHIEDIQDVTERGISEAGFFEASKSYILYREQHKRLRDKTEADTQRIRIKVKKRDGSYVAFDIGLLENKLRRYFEGFSDKAVMYDILEELRLSVFDGMSTQEIDKSLIMSLVARIERGREYSKLAAKALMDSVYKGLFRVDTSDPSFEAVYRSSFKAKLQTGVDQGRLDPKIMKFSFKKLSDALVPERDLLLMYPSAQMLFDKYVLKGVSQEILETPQYFWMRVAMGLSLTEDEKEEKAIEFYNVMSQLLYVASSPTLYHSGLVHSQMSSCFLMTVEDDLDHIFKSFGDQAQLAKYAGGIGLDWTNVRATGALIKSTNVPSQGVVPFLKICDSTNASINRSGRKRGAAVVYLEPWHFDIESFLELRRNVGDERRRTHNINTALWIPDLFMKRVSENGEWTLFSPDETPELHHLYGLAFDKKYLEYEAEADAGNMVLIKKMKAADLWKRIITMLFETGHPWLTFKDPCNIRSPQDHVGIVHSSNLCTEITLNTSRDEIAVCNLGSINLSAHTSDDGVLDKDLIRQSVRVAMRILDNVIDANFYPVKETANSNLKHRPVGLGIMGFQDMLSKGGISFDSEVAVKLSDEVQELVSYNAILASSELAKERGAYPSYKGSKWDRNIFPQDTFKLMEEIRGVKTHIPHDGKLDWSPVRAHVKKYGMRNSNCLAIAPTASISNLASCTPSIEPPYSNLYVKSNMFGEFIVSNDYLVQDLKAIDLWSPAMLDAIKSNDGNIQGISEIPIHIRSKYKGAFDVDPHWVVRHAAHRSKWLDQSQSVNIFTNTIRGKVLSEIYMDAWKSGLKTTYYLRTLGASSIEKSTVSLESQGVSSAVGVTSQVEETYVEVVAAAPSTVVAEMEVVELTEVLEETAVYAMAPAQAPVLEVESYEFKACRLDDPTCESCQ